MDVGFGAKILGAFLANGFRALYWENGDPQRETGLLMDCMDVELPYLPIGLEIESAW